MNRRVRGSPRGQTLVELAMVLPLFLVLVIGIFDVGRLVLYDSTLANVARDGVRLAIVDQNVTNIQQRVVQEAAPVLELTTADVQVRFLAPDLAASGTCTVAPYEIGCVAEVTVTYSAALIIPITGPLTLSAITHQPIERSFISP